MAELHGWDEPEDDELCPYCGEEDCEDSCTAAMAAGEPGDLAEAWLCTVGHWHEDGLHCPTTGQEPPYGCPCSTCQDGEGGDDWGPLEPGEAP